MFAQSRTRCLANALPTQSLHKLIINFHIWWLIVNSDEKCLISNRSLSRIFMKERATNSERERERVWGWPFVEPFSAYYEQIIFLPKFRQWIGSGGGGEEGGEIEPRTSQDETMTGLRTHRQNVRKKKIMWRLIVAENNVLMIGPWSRYVRVSVTRLGNFYIVLGDKLSFKSSSNIWSLWGSLKTLLFNQSLPWLVFEQL